MPALVQTAAGVSSAAATLTVALPQPTGLGALPYGANALIAVVFAWGDGGTAPTLGAGSVKLGTTTMTQQGATQIAGATGAGAFAFYAIPSVPSGQTAVTVTVTGVTTGNSISAACYEFAGMATSSLLDQFPAVTAGETSAWSSASTGTTSQPSEVAIGAYGGWNSVAWTPEGPASPWVNTAVQTSATEGGLLSKFFAGYRILTSPQTLTYAGSGGTTLYWNEAVIATFRGGAAQRPTGGTVSRRDPRRARGRAGPGPGASAGSAPAPGPLTAPVLPVPAQLVPADVTGAVTVVQQVTLTSAYDYGLSTVNMTTTDGNTLVVLAGWDLSTQATDAAMPAAWVTDSAGNVWHHVATTSSSVTGSRCCAWVCVNARPVSWVSVSLTTFASSLACTVAELANMPQEYSLAAAAANSDQSAATLPVTGGAPGSPAIAFTLLTAGTSGLTPPAPPGWTALTGVTSGAAGPNPVQIAPYWRTAAAAQSLDITWDAGRAVPLSGVTFAIEASAQAPVQGIPDFPVLAVQAGFGYTPGDPSQAPPTWVDITSRTIGKKGAQFITSLMGREYELSTPESGELHIALNNVDGAFTPGNTNSPYWPDVVAGTPMRVLAWWLGRWYHIGFGWAERWPQDWPDLPQWGLSQMIATDAISVMSSASMVAALDADMLLDEPYVLLQCAEQYFSYSNGLNSAGILDSYSLAPAQGLIASNASRVNGRAAMYVDGTAAQCATGQATYMLGDSDTGFGTTSISAAPTVASSGPGVIYTDPGLPSPRSPNGVSVEFWVVIGATVTSPDLQPTVFSAYGPPSAYAKRPSLSARILNYTGSASLQVTTAAGNTFTAPFSVSGSPQQIALTITQSALSIYVNGSLGATASLTSADTTTWRAVSLGCPNYAWAAGSIGVGNFVAFDLGIYAYQLPFQRIVSHYSTGAEGQKGVDATARLAQILAWANLGIPRAGQITFGGASASVTEGSAYSLSGQTAADAANQLATNEAGMVVAAPSGSVVFLHREALFNLPPVQTFGDSIAVADAQIPYLKQTAFDYDNTYIYDRVSVTLQVGPNTTITVITNDFASQAQYFLRSALKQTIQTTSDLDVYSLAQWNLAKYSQPQIRVRNIVIDAASNPAAFPAVLSIQQGQVATVTRNPVGGAPITETVQVQKIQHTVGPSVWRVAMQLSPYAPLDSVLQLGVPPHNTLGGSTLA